VKPLSIRLQLSLMISLLTLVIVAVLSVAAYIEFKESLLDNVDATLMAVGEGIRAQLDEENHPDFQAELLAIAGHGNPTYSSPCRVWLDGAEKDLFTSDSPQDSLPRALYRLPADKRPEVADFRLFNITDDSVAGRTRMFRTLWMRQAPDRQVVNILVARSSDQVYHEVGEFLQLLLILGGIVMGTALLLAPRIVSWGLRSISYAGRQLDQVTHRSLRQESQAMGDVPVELQPFKSALDGMLLRLNRAVQQQVQLTADVTHELRTPVAVIKSTLQTLRMKPRTVAECEEGIDDALRDVARMEQLVTQLLILARLDSVDEVANPTEVRLDLLLQSIAEIFDTLAGQLGTSMVCVDGNEASVRGDENELRQLFSNLLDNALRYGPPEGVVRISLEDGPGPWVTACVHDEGGTIPSEHLPRLFDRFYRADASRSQSCGGTGLGLAIAHQIVQRHHGEIAIASDPHAGTLVTVRLPRQ